MLLNLNSATFQYDLTFHSLEYKFFLLYFSGFPLFSFFVLLNVGKHKSLSLILTVEHLKYDIALSPNF